MSIYDPGYTTLKELITEVEDRDVPDDIKVKLKNIADLMVARETFCDEMTSKPSDPLQTIMKTSNELPSDQLLEEGKTKVLMRHTMLSGNKEGKILKFFVSASKAKSVLEVGTFTGCSALMMAEALPEDGTVTSCDFDPYIQEMARGLVDKSPHGYKIKMLQGPATDTLHDLAKKGQQFDFIFIDANKDQYIDYFNISIDKLLAPGGTIMADNALFYGAAYDKNIEKKRGEDIRKFDEAVAQRTDIYHVLAPIRDGIMMIRRKEDTDGTVKK